MNIQQRNYICLDRRKEQRRELRGISVMTTIFEPNPFSRRNGTERRDAIMMYREQRQAS